MTPAQKQAFVARMAAARGKTSPKPTASAPKPSAPSIPAQTVAGNFGSCPNCGKNVSMAHSC